MPMTAEDRQWFSSVAGRFGYHLEDPVDANSFTAQQVGKKLQAKADDLGGQAQLAAQLEVTPGYISNVIHGRALPSKRILALLGLEKRRIVSYIYYPVPTDQRQV